MESFEIEMTARDIDFNAVDRSIICFGHTVELCSKRIINVACGAVDGEGNDGDDARDDEGDDASSDDDASNALSSSIKPVPKARAVVRVIRASGLRRDAFDEVISNGNEKGWFKQGQPPKVVTVPHLQLLRDVRTRWDSVYVMLRRLRMLRPVRPLFIERNNC